jgi:hypothetical protein
MDSVLLWLTLDEEKGSTNGTEFERSNSVKLRTRWFTVMCSGQAERNSAKNRR